MSGGSVQYDLKQFEAKFSLPEKITVKQALQFWAVFSGSINNREMLFVELWAVIVRLGLIENWECAYFSLETPLEAVFDPRVATLVMHICTLVYKHMESLRVTGKN